MSNRNTAPVVEQILFMWIFDSLSPLNTWKKPNMDSFGSYPALFSHE